MGMLKPEMANAHYSSAGQLSPLLNDPYFLTIGMGTKIFLGGGVGYVAWHGTQHFPGMQTDATGKSFGPAGGTIAVIGDLKQMKPGWLRGASFMGYGVTLTVGIGIPIPILNEDVMSCVSITDRDLYAQVVDYSEAYSQRLPENLGFVSYADLKTGKINLLGKEVLTAPLSSYIKAKEIAETLKGWILQGSFLLSEPARPLPSFMDQLKANTLEIR
jgi:uncharacterized protein (DUF39 family)